VKTSLCLAALAASLFAGCTTRSLLEPPVPTVERAPALKRPPLRAAESRLTVGPPPPAPTVTISASAFLGTYDLLVSTDLQNWLTVATLTDTNGLTIPTQSLGLYRGLVRTVRHTLAWSAAAGVTGYKLHFGTASGSCTNVVDVGNVTRCTLTESLASYFVYYATSSYNAAGQESGLSNMVVGTNRLVLVIQP
jgi:hypothetical protein